MNQRYILPVFVLVLASVSLLDAQPQISSDQIMSSELYYFGRGEAYDYEMAKQGALNELTEQISVLVVSDFFEKIQETNRSMFEQVESIIRTHSSATLKNVNWLLPQMSHDGRVNLFCYMLKTEVEAIYEERRKLIANIVKKADEMALEMNLGHALKNYYFAVVLLGSLPNQSVSYEGTNYTIEIPDRINRIIHGVRFQYLNERRTEQERQITFSVQYEGKPVSRIDFSFWDGAQQITVESRDGLATVSLFGSSMSMKELRIAVKTVYYKEREEYPIVKQLWEIVKKPPYRYEQKVALTKEERVFWGKNKSTTVIISNSVYTIQLESRDEDAPVDTILREANRFIEIISRADELVIEQQYGDDPFLAGKIRSYHQFNQPRVMDSEIQSNLNKTHNGWEMRSIRMHHSYPSLQKETTEYLILDFSEEGQLLDLNLSITDALYQKFVRQGNYCGDWENRQAIIKFLERYRTAYQTRDINTVGAMFADEALIIIGRKIRTQILPPERVQYERLGNEPTFEYLEMTKKVYLRKQKAIFDSQQDFLLDFSTFNIVSKGNAPGVYGVEMRQNYNVTTYADEGYLFLLVDFTEKDPLIYVRTWQPNTWNIDELITTANYRVHKYSVPN